MSEQPVMLKLLLREKHWQNYSTFCAEYDKAARRIDADLAGRYPSRAQLHRWLTGAVRSLPFADHCRVLEEMFPGWTAEQLFQPTAGERPLTAPGGAVIPPASVVLSTGLRPYIEHAFTAEHVIIDFAGFSGETRHSVVQEPLDKIRTGEIKPESVSIRMLLPGTTRPMAIPFPDGAHPMYDLMGKDAVVFRHSKTTGHAADAQFVDQAQAWFNSMWDHISYEFPA